MQNKVTINATKQCEFKRVRCCSLECQCSVQLYSVLGCTQTLQTPAGRIATVWVRVVTAGSWTEAAPAALCSLHHPNPQYCSADTNTCIRQQNTQYILSRDNEGFQTLSLDKERILQWPLCHLSQKRHFIIGTFSCI